MNMAVRERVSLPVTIALPSPAAEVPVDLVADNRRLQDLLHQTLRREAEALRKLKHLSLQLAELRAAGRTPTPVQANGELQGCAQNRIYCELAWLHEIYVPFSVHVMAPLRSSCVSGGESRGRSVLG